MKLSVGLFAFALMLQSCATITGPKKIASEWCDCMKDSGEIKTDQSKKFCDSIAEVSLDLILREKMRQAQEKQFPLDSVREFLHSTHMEYHNLIENCKKNE